MSDHNTTTLRPSSFVITDIGEYVRVSKARLRKLAVEDAVAQPAYSSFEIGVRINPPPSNP